MAGAEPVACSLSRVSEVWASLECADTKEQGASRDRARSTPGRTMRRSHAIFGMVRLCAHTRHTNHCVSGLGVGKSRTSMFALPHM